MTAPVLTARIEFASGLAADEWTIADGPVTTTVRVAAEHPHEITVYRTVSTSGDAVLDERTRAQLREFRRGELPEHAATQILALHAQNGDQPCH